MSKDTKQHPATHLSAGVVKAVRDAARTLRTLESFADDWERKRDRSVCSWEREALHELALAVGSAGRDAVHSLRSTGNAAPVAAADYLEKLLLDLPAVEGS